MKDIKKDSIELSAVLYACFTEELQFEKDLASIKGKCKSILEKLPVELQEAICNDPIVALFAEKNIFTIGESFFKEKAIATLGCKLATKLILSPLRAVQQQACQLVDFSGEKEIEYFSFSLDIESINDSCSLLVTDETRNVVATCFPNYTMTADPEKIMENRMATEALCTDNMILLSRGEKIKICDDIFRAFMPEFKSTIGKNKLSFPKQLKNFAKMYGISLKEDSLSLNMSRAERNAHRLLKYFLGHRIVEKTACYDLEREDKPFIKDKPLFNLIKFTCFSSVSIYEPLPENRSQAIFDLHGLTCGSFIDYFNGMEKEQFCHNPSQLFHDLRTSQFFKQGIYHIKHLCNTSAIEDEDIIQDDDTKEENSGETPYMLNNTNVTQGIKNVSLEKIIKQRPAHHHVSAMHYEKKPPFFEYVPANNAIAGALEADKINTLPVVLGTLDALILGGIAAVTTTGLVAIGFWAKKRFFGPAIVTRDHQAEQSLSTERFSPP